MDLTTTFINVQRDYLCFGVASFPNDDAGLRGDITEFSDASRRRMLSVIKNAAADYRVFVTLTYPPGYGASGIQAKRDLCAFRKRLARIQVVPLAPGQDIPRGSDGRSWSVIWFQEWQKNGRIHFHLAGTHYLDKEWLSNLWYEVVSSGLSDHLAAGTNIKKITGGRSGVAAYAAKYMAKQEQKVPPADWDHVGRFWGIWGDRRTVAASTSLNPRVMASSEVSTLLDQLIITVEEGLVTGSLVELPSETSDLADFRQFRIAKDAFRVILAQFVRAIDYEKARENLNFGSRSVAPFVWSGLHTRMFHVEHKEELI